ncbi:MAG: hypothetical protein HY898_01955 [Deltaproteobacteria bacterium]|nr:hypothetical protein [Deltaproteobacteria bacterium]
MRTGLWIGMVGSIAAVALFACSSSDTGGGNFTPKDGGTGGSVVGKGGSGGGTAGQGGGTAGQGGGTAGQGGGTAGQGGGTAGQGGGTAGQGGGTGGTGGGGNCDPATKQKSTECSDCMKAGSSCAAEAKACQDDAQCVSFNDCIGKCSDNACIEGCVTQFSTGVAKFWKFYGCNDAACHGNCYCSNCGLWDPAQACGQCVEGSCMNECSACANDASCMGLLYCISYCPNNDTVCMGNCQSAPELSGGVNPLMALAGSSGGCMATKCTSQCQ